MCVPSQHDNSLPLCVHLLNVASFGLQLTFQVTELGACGTDEVGGDGCCQSLQLVQELLLLTQQQVTHLKTRQAARILWTQKSGMIEDMQFHLLSVSLASSPQGSSWAGSAWHCSHAFHAEQLARAEFSIHGG